MAQTLQDLYGASATSTGTTITFDYSDFASTGLDGANPTPSQIMAAHLKWLVETLTPAIEDATAGIAPDTFQQDKNFVTRGNEPQIAQPFTLLAYRPDSTATFDPDDVL